MVSLVVLTVLLATTTTPEQARAQRAVPVLPPPTMAVVDGSREGVLAIPKGAVVTDAESRTWVTVRTGRSSRRVEVHGVGADRSGLVQVIASGLHAGDRVELVASDEAALLPPGRPG